jgi:nitroreductase
VVVLCSLQTDGLVQYRDLKRTSLEWQMAVQSVGGALQTLFLVAQSHGIGSCWMAAPMYCAEAVREALRLPQDFEPQALVLMGYAAKPGKIRERRPLAEVFDLR